MNRRATKWQVMQSISRYLGFSQANIITFGDDFNDVEMICECGIGVAVGNAVNEVREVADAVCDTNDNNGEAK